MERLTYRNLDGQASYNTLDMRKLANRLAAYEDTGLEPENLEAGKFLLQYLAENKGCLTGALGRLHEILEAENDGRLAVLPEVPEADRKLFADNLHDVFTEWANYDPSVGIFGMSEGERALADAIMKALTPDKAQAALAEEGEPST